MPKSPSRHSNFSTGHFRRLKHSIGTTSTNAQSTTVRRNTSQLHSSHVYYNSPLPNPSQTLNGQRIYDTLGHRFFWPFLANYIRMTVKDCDSCFQNGSQMELELMTQLFPVAGPLKFAAVDIWDHYQKQCRVANAWLL